MNAIWSLALRVSKRRSQKLYKNNYRKITKNYCKTPSKELQYGYRKGDALLDHEIFFFLFFGISGAEAILLRLFSFAAVGPHRTGDIPLRVQKSPSGFQTGFFAFRGRRMQKPSLFAVKV